MLRIGAAAILAYLTLALPAWAYLDPGTGMIALQAIAGAAAVVMVAWRGFWLRVKSLFMRSQK